MVIDLTTAKTPPSPNINATNDKVTKSKTEKIVNTPNLIIRNNIENRVAVRKGCKTKMKPLNNQQAHLNTSTSRSKSKTKSNSKSKSKVNSKQEMILVEKKTLKKKATRSQSLSKQSKQSTRSIRSQEKKNSSNSNSKQNKVSKHSEKYKCPICDRNMIAGIGKDFYQRGEWICDQCECEFDGKNSLFHCNGDSFHNCWDLCVKCSANIKTQEKARNNYSRTL